MSNEALAVNTQQVRGLDSNSLLRLYDLAKDVCKRTSSQQERARADKAIRLIRTELEKRKVAL
jgi:hypothetical protein